MYPGTADVTYKYNIRWTRTRLRRVLQNNQENHSYHPRFGIKFVIHRLETRLPAEQCAQQVSQTFKCDLCEGRMLLNLRVALLQVPNVEIN